MMLRLLKWLIARGWLKVYSQGHLYHGDGSLYMGRWQVFTTRWLSCRLHHIATADLDRHFHDHPWGFVSLVLTGGYHELRPVDVEPCFGDDEGWELAEVAQRCWRGAGSLGLRRATDRHRVQEVLPDTYTLFFYGPKRQWWGFYTPDGKVYWRDYPSCHAALHPGAAPIEERT